MDIKDKVVIITGASQGIGLALAKDLAKNSAQVVLAARSGDVIESVTKELPQAMAVVTDMRKPEDIKNLMDKTLEKYGRIDVLVNNAGQGMYGPLETINIKQYKEIMELNVYGYLRAMQAVIPQMKKQGGGTIVNVSSRVSKNYFPALSAYASTKYAVNALSLTARQELEKDNIVVSVFHPKMTSTDFNKHSLGVSPYWQARPGDPPPQIDTPEQVAVRIVKLIESGESEAMM